jgi:hypothetical protein
MPQVPAPYTPIPSAVLVHQARLGLSPQQLCLIAQLQSFQWDHRLPYPSVTTLARRMGCSRTQVQRYLHELEARGYLRVHPRRRSDGGTTSNAYDLSPLWQQAQALAAAATGGELPGAAPGPAATAGQGDGAPAAPPAAAMQHPPAAPARRETTTELNPAELKPDTINRHHPPPGSAPAPAAPSRPHGPPPAAGAGGAGDTDAELFTLLRERGMTVRTAQLLVRTYPAERIRAQLACLERLPAPPRNPAGWLVCAIRQNFCDARAAGGAPQAAPGGSRQAAPVPRQEAVRPAGAPLPAEQRAVLEVAALEAIRQQLGLGPFSAAERARREALARAYYASLALPPAGERDPGGPRWEPPPAGERGRGGAPVPLGALLGGVLPAPGPGPARGEAPADVLPGARRSACPGVPAGVP